MLTKSEIYKLHKTTLELIAKKKFYIWQKEEELRKLREQLAETEQEENTTRRMLDNYQKDYNINKEYLALKNENLYLRSELELAQNDINYYKKKIAGYESNKKSNKKRDMKKHDKIT